MGRHGCHRNRPSECGERGVDARRERLCQRATKAAGGLAGRARDGFKAESNGDSEKSDAAFRSGIYWW